MTAHPHTEDQLVEQPAIGLFAALVWQTVSAMDEPFGPGRTRAPLLPRLLTGLMDGEGSGP